MVIAVKVVLVVSTVRWCCALFFLSILSISTILTRIQCGSLSRNTPYTYVPTQALRKVTMMTE